MNDYTQHRIDQAEFLKEELQSTAFKDARKRVLVHHIPIFGVKPDTSPPAPIYGYRYWRMPHLIFPSTPHTHRYRVIEREKQEITSLSFRWR
jgi:hypothetical protein